MRLAKRPSHERAQGDFFPLASPLKKTVQFRFFIFLSFTE